MANLSCNIRFQRDLKELASAPNIDSPPVFANAVDDKLDHAVALVMGPSETPYHFGFFFFDIRLPETYPNDPPKVKITTTDYGRTRFNPNLYADGKVCLSILGTWRGETSEVWRSSYSISYVLNAIQSLIMNSCPYRNEPGFEGDPPDEMQSEEGDEEGEADKTRDPQKVKNEIEAYNNKILSETLRVAVCDVLESCLSGKLVHFAPQVKREFLMRYESYVETCNNMIAKKLDGQAYLKMPFEYAGNGVDGKFDFKGLLGKLQTLRARLDAETDAWRLKGKELTARRSYVSSTLKDEQVKLNSQQAIEGVSGGPASEDNAFVWDVTIFGPEGTLYEEGIFQLEIVFPEDSNEFPRPRFVTEMFHPNISPSGYPLFHIPMGKEDNVEFLLKSLKKMLMSEPNPSSATWVNIIAAQQCFHKDEALQKDWKKKVRAMARRSSE